MARECYCVVLREAARKVTTMYDAALEPTGVTIAQFSLLRTIQRAGPLSLTELGRMTDLERSTVGRNVKVIERLRLVQVTAGVDQRETTVNLAEKGLDVLERGAPLWNAAQDKIEAILGATTASAIRTQLQSL